MSILDRGAGLFPSLTRRARKYRSLADDLERIARGQHPTDVDLSSVPHLSDWQLYPLPLPYMLGTVVGHPIIEDGQICRTSEIVTFDPMTVYARTYSRFYRLGVHHG
jgi:hypothetical protein